ncbi:MAG: cyclase family protein [Clostridiaceae bacterium]|nr:cyclase family protein [Clostridiaceae bacterium]
MKIYDISMEISHEMPVYKARDFKRPIIETDSDFQTGKVYESRINMNLHTGTHFDAPLHVTEKGKTLDELSLERVVTSCKVLDLSYAENKVTSEDLVAKKIEKGDFILIKTKNSSLDILEKDFIYLDETAALYLKDKNISGIGIDSLGIERDQPGHPTHKTLLNAGILILEGLRLADVPEGEYFLIAAPLKIKGVEAAPVRAILLSKDTLANVL